MFRFAKNSKSTKQQNPDLQNNIPEAESNKKFKLKSWYSNRYQIVLVQRNILLFLSIMLTIAMTASIVFVKFVVSSKSLEPYVIEIEEKSGVPTVVNQMTSKDLTANEAVKNYFINQFIQACAGYDPKTYKRDANIVRLLSTQKIYSEFRNRINPRELGVDTKITPRIKSVQFIAPEKILVRLLLETNSKNKGIETKDYIIEMSFYFANLTLNAEERLINPLGFQVIQFTMVEEKFDY